MFGHMNCGDIPWNLGLKNRPEIYGIGTSNESDPELWPLTLGPSKHMGRFHKLGPWNPFVGCVLRPLCNTHTQKIPNIDHIDTKSSALGISWLIFTHPTGKPIIKPKVFSTNQGIAFWRSTMASKQHPTFSPMSFPTRNLHLWDLPYFHIYFPYIFPWCSHFLVGSNHGKLCALALNQLRNWLRASKPRARACSRRNPQRMVW